VSADWQIAILIHTKNSAFIMAETVCCSFIPQLNVEQMSARFQIPASPIRNGTGEKGKPENRKKRIRTNALKQTGREKLILLTEGRNLISHGERCFTTGSI
jgi:hypothetical protein